MSEQSLPPALAGLHHLKLPALSIDATHDFYVSVLGFQPQPQLTHRNADGTPYALLAKYPGTTGNDIVVEFRQAPEQAALQKGWDPITWAVATKTDLDKWAAWLDEKKARHSKVIRGVVGWVLVADDPDGRRIRLYTLEQHEWDGKEEWDEEWMGKKE